MPEAQNVPNIGPLTVKKLAPAFLWGMACILPTLIFWNRNLLALIILPLGLGFAFYQSNRDVIDPKYHKIGFAFITLPLSEILLGLLLGLGAGLSAMMKLHGMDKLWGYPLIGVLLSFPFAMYAWAVFSPLLSKAGKEKSRLFLLICMGLMVLGVFALALWENLPFTLSSLAPMKELTLVTVGLTAGAVNVFLRDFILIYGAYQGFKTRTQRPTLLQEIAGYFLLRDRPESSPRSNRYGRAFLLGFLVSLPGYMMLYESVFWLVLPLSGGIAFMLSNWDLKDSKGIRLTLSLFILPIGLGLYFLLGWESRVSSMDGLNGVGVWEEYFGIGSLCAVFGLALPWYFFRMGWEPFTPVQGAQSFFASCVVLGGIFASTVAIEAGLWQLGGEVPLDPIYPALIGAIALGAANVWLRFLILRHGWREGVKTKKAVSEETASSD